MEANLPFGGSQVDEDLSQFKFYNPVEDTARHLASEALLKEIGVDIKKFLASRGEGEDKLLSESLNQLREIQREQQQSYHLQLPSLVSLGQPGGGQIQTTKVLDQKFRQMQYSKNIPTDDEVDQFRESHRLRMLRMEERYMQSSNTENHNDDDSIFKMEVEKAKLEVQKIPQEEIKEIVEEKIEELFMMSTRRKFSEEEQPMESLDDMQIEDMSDFEENEQIDTTNTIAAIPKRQEKIIMVRKNQVDKQEEKILIESLIDHIATQMLQDPQYTTPPKEVVPDGEESDSDFGNIDAILESQSKDQKLYHSDEKSSNVPIQVLSVHDPVEIDELSKAKFRAYLSWQTPDPNIVMAKVEISQDQVQTFNEMDNVDYTHPDPHILSESQNLAEREDEFRYNEHGIYSEQSEDEESSVVQCL